MTTSSNNWSCGSLRLKCLVIGYINLIAAFVDVVVHFFIVAVVSRDFECDIDQSLVAAIDWSWIEPVLLIINLGTHGFYPFPLMLRSFNNAHVEYMTIPSEPKCYPGMIHIYQIDFLNFFINIIWLCFVINYVKAVHKKNPEDMRMFYGVSLVKLGVQMVYFAYPGNLIPVENFWCLRLADMCIAFGFLLIMNAYIKQLRSEGLKTVDRPPSYIECLINGPQTKKEDKTPAAVTQTEQKIELPEEMPARV